MLKVFVGLRCLAVEDSRCALAASSVLPLIVFKCQFADS